MSFPIGSCCLAQLDHVHPDPSIFDEPAAVIFAASLWSAVGRISNRLRGRSGLRRMPSARSRDGNGGKSAVRPGCARGGRGGSNNKEIPVRMGFH